MLRTGGIAAALALLPATAMAVDPVQVSVERGLIQDTQPFAVELSCATPGATIHYTLDGSNPRVSATAQSGPSGTQVMIDPGASAAPGVVLRAYASLEPDFPSRVAAHTYIFLPDVLTQPETIPGWQVYDYDGSGGPAHHDYEMDPAIVNDPAYAGELIDALTSIPTLSISADAAELWTAYRGEAEIFASVEVIYPEGDSEDTTAGLERHSHDRVKNSMRLSWKTEYEDPKWTTELLRRSPLNGAGAVDKLDRLVLRGGNNRSWARNWNPDRTTYTTDQWIRDTTIELSGVGAHGTFVHLYLNGIYFGLYNPAERLDEWFTSAYMGGDEDMWFAISHSGPKGGDPARFDYLTGPLHQKDMSDLANYQELTEYLDVDVFSDYLLVHWYAGVRDWPANNWWGGNRNVPETPFMYFSWDGEWSFGVGKGSPTEPQVHPEFLAGVDKNTGATVSRLFNTAKDSPEFLLRFADRAYRALHNDGALRDDHARARWETLNEHLRTPVVAESARWGDAVIGGPTRTRDVDWQNEVDFQDAYMDGAAAQLVSALRAEGYYPPVDPPRFRDGASVIEVTQLELEMGASLLATVELDGGTGTIYYTVDGTDPREVGGAAVGLDGGETVDVDLVSPVVLKARTLDGNDWSALHLLEVVEVGGGTTTGPPTTGGTTDSGGDSGGTGGGTGSAGETDGGGSDGGGDTGASGSGPGGGEASGDGDGCACRTSRRRGPASRFTLALLLLIFRRRRAPATVR